MESQRPPPLERPASPGQANASMTSELGILIQTTPPDMEAGHPAEAEASLEGISDPEVLRRMVKSLKEQRDRLQMEVQLLRRQSAGSPIGRGGLGSRRSSVSSPRPSNSFRRFQHSHSDEQSPIERQLIPRVSSSSSISPSQFDMSPRWLQCQEYFEACEQEIEKLQQEIEARENLNRTLVNEGEQLDSQVSGLKKHLVAWQDQLATCQKAVAVEKKQREKMRRALQLQQETFKNEERQFREEKEKWLKKREEWESDLKRLEAEFKNARASTQPELDALQRDLKQIKLHRMDSGVKHLLPDNTDGAHPPALTISHQQCTLREEKMETQIAELKREAETNTGLVTAFKEMSNDLGNQVAKLKEAAKLDSVVREQLMRDLRQAGKQLETAKQQAATDAMIRKQLIEDQKQCQQLVRRYKAETDQLHRNAASEAERHQLQSAVDKLLQPKEVQQLREQLGAALKEVAALKNRELENKKVTTKLAQSTSSANMRKRFLQATAENLQEEVTTLREQLSSCSSSRQGSRDGTPIEVPLNCNPALDSLQRENISIKRERDRIQHEYEEQVRTLDAKIEELQTANRARREYESKLQQLQREHEMLSGRSLELETALSESEDKARKLECKAAALAEDEEELKTALAKQQAEAQMRHHELHTNFKAEAEALTKRQKEAVELEAAMVSKEEELRAKAEELGEVQVRVEELTEAQAAAERLVKELEAALSTQNGELRKAQETIVIKEEARATLVSKVEAAEAALRAREQELKETRETSTSITELVEASEAAFRTIEEELKETRAAAASTTEQLETARNALSSMEEKLAEAQRLPDKEEEGSAQKDLEERFQKKEEELRNVHTAMVTKEEELKEIRATLNITNAKVEEKEDELRAALLGKEEAVQKVQSALDAKTELLQNQDEELQKASNARTELQEENAELARQNDELQREFEEQVRLVDTKIDEIQEMRRVMQKQEAEHEEQLQAVQEREEALRNQEAELKQYTEEIVKERSGKRQLDLCSTSGSESDGTVSGQVGELLLRIQRLSQELEEVKDANARYASELELCKDTSDAAEEKRKHFEGQAAGYLARIQTLEQSVTAGHDHHEREALVAELNKRERDGLAAELEHVTAELDSANRRMESMVPAEAAQKLQEQLAALTSERDTLKLQLTLCNSAIPQAATLNSSAAPGENTNTTSTMCISPPETPGEGVNPQQAVQLFPAAPPSAQERGETTKVLAGEETTITVTACSPPVSPGEHNGHGRESRATLLHKTLEKRLKEEIVQLTREVEGERLRAKTLAAALGKKIAVLTQQLAETHRIAADPARGGELGRLAESWETQLEQALHQVTKDSEAQRDIVRSLEAATVELAEAKRSNAKLKRKLEKMRSDTDDEAPKHQLEAELQQVCARRDALEGEVGALQAQDAVRLREVAAHRERRAGLEREVAALKVQREDMEGRLLQYEVEGAQHSTEAAALRREKEEAEGRLRTECQELAEEVTRLSREASDLRFEKQELVGEAAKHRTRADTLRYEKEDVERRLQRSEQRAVSVEQDLTAVRLRHDTTKRELDEAEGRVDRLSRERNNLQLQLLDCRDAVKTSEQDVPELRQQVAAAQTELSECRRKLATANAATAAAASSAAASAENKQEELNAVIANIDKELFQVRKERDELKAQLQKLTQMREVEQLALENKALRSINALPAPASSSPSRSRSTATASPPIPPVQRSSRTSPLRRSVSPASPVGPLRLRSSSPRSPSPVQYPLKLSPRSKRLSSRRQDWEVKHHQFEDNVSTLKQQLEGLSDAMRRSSAAAHQLSDRWGDEFVAASERTAAPTPPFPARSPSPSHSASSTFLRTATSSNSPVKNSSSAVHW